jgi:FkbM family methyltransferase
MTQGAPNGPVGPIVHRAKRLIQAPYRRRRRRIHRDGDPALVQLLEHFEYRKAIYGFVASVAENPSLLHEVETSRADAILDIGGYIGEWCVPVAARTDRPIHVFEPSVWARARLEAACADHPNIIIHTYGLGAADATVSLARIGPGSSHLDPSPEWERADVPIRDVVAVFAELGFSRVAVKLNIEGGEYDVLERLIASGEIRRVDSLLIQFHEWLPWAHLRRRRIRRRLRATHRVVWEYPWVWERWEPLE